MVEYVFTRYEPVRVRVLWVETPPVDAGMLPRELKWLWTECRVTELGQVVIHRWLPHNELDKSITRDTLGSDAMRLAPIL